MMNRETIYLAGLLHDIGKFWQRADDSGSTTSTILSASTKANEGMYCPGFNGRYSHKHVLWTAEFLDKYRDFFEAILGKDDYEAFFKACVKHHRPDSDDVYQLIVQKADHYSSGADRTGATGEKDANAENSWDSFKNVKMVSILEGIQREPGYSSKRRLPIKPLSLDDDHFPALETEKVKGQISYAELWKQFEMAFAELTRSGADLHSFAESLTFLLYRYTVAVPSSTMHLPDVSLYDHLRSTGIYALCLYDYLNDSEKLAPGFVINNQEAPVLLVGGDLSGIQNYIYDIVSNDAARNLKGRSFYLQILAENAVEWLLKELQLPWASVIYSSGGGFYLLAPNTPRIHQTLEKVRKEIADSLFEAHQTSLTLSIEWEEVSVAQIMQLDTDKQENSISQAWSALTKKISAGKARKFADRLVNDYDYFFTPGEIGGMQRKDIVTGEEFTEAENRAANNNQFGGIIEKDDDDKPMKINTYRQIELGKTLRSARYWVTSSNPIRQWENREYRVGKFPVFNYLLSENDLRTNPLRHPDDVFIRDFEIDHSGYSEKTEYFRGKRCVYGFTFYGGNAYPAQADGSPVTFDKMAEATPANRLGVLRMDVDNLGSIFISGLEKGRRTFSRYSVLSRSLDYFFKGYLNRIWELNFKSDTSIIYSGGDDLFIVGNWESVYAFAEQIHQNFSRWVCYNPALTISGGIALTSGKFPISKGAVFSEDAEKLAKEHEQPGNVEKNAICIFNVPLSWNKEFPMVQSLKNELTTYVNQKIIPRSILQKLLSYAEKARIQEGRDLTREKAGLGDRKNKSHQWRWHMAYDFSRAAERQKNEDVTRLYEMIKTAAYTGRWMDEEIAGYSRHHFLDLIEVSARWAELETKKNVHI